MTHVLLYKKIFWQLLRTEFIDLRKTFVSQAIDLTIWVFCTVVILSYLLGTQFHIAHEFNFGVFNLAGCIGTVGIFDAYTRMFLVTADLEGPSTFSYYVTLPIPAWLYFMSKMFYWSFFSFLKALLALFVGKLVLWNAFNITNIAVVPALLVLLVSNLFYGVFALSVVSLVPDMSRMRSVWMRFIFPLWFFGGFQFSWCTMYGLSPRLAYVTLLNPVVYIMESTRGVILGQSGYLPWQLCVSVLLFFIMVLSAFGIKSMKRRLDLV